MKVVDRACRGASSYTRALKAKRASQGLRSSVVDLALLLTAHEKRSVKDYAEAAIESPVNAVQRHSQGTGNSGASYSDVQAAGNAVGHGPRSQPDGRDQDISTHLKEMLHLLSLFHAASMASLRTAEDYSSYTVRLSSHDPHFLNRWPLFRAWCAAILGTEHVHVSNAQRVRTEASATSRGPFRGHHG